MAAAGTPKDDTGLERKMESRHLAMISLGGVIGTGLFVSFRLYDSSGGAVGRDPRLRGRLPARLLCDGLAGRAVRGHAVCR